MSVITRLATAADATRIAAISRQSFYETFSEDNTPEDMELFMNDSFSTGRLVDEVTMPVNTFIVAIMNGDMVGYAKLTESDPPATLNSDNAIEIARLYAVQQVIGQGIGKALMMACLNIAKQKNKLLLWLGVWEHNKRAQEFYHRFGFEKFGEHPFILGSDVQTDWLMKKILRVS